MNVISFAVRRIICNFTAQKFRILKMYTVFHKFRDTCFRAFRRYDLSAWEGTPRCDKPIYGVYHIYCDKGWQRMVRDQIGRLRESGLYDVTTRLFVSVITRTDDDLQQLEGIIGREKMEVISATSDPRRFEYPALMFIRERAQSEDCLFYYFHTKGITYQAASDADRKFNAFKRNIEAWRHMMEYSIFFKWRVAVNVLTADYDTCGCYRLPPIPQPYYLYAGNFWWARATYLRRLPEFDETTFATNRFYAEEWLYKAAPNDFSTFDTQADLYFVYMPECLYAAKRLPLWEAVKFVVIYNLRKARKQYLHHDYKAEYQKRYQVLR